MSSSGNTRNRRRGKEVCITIHMVAHHATDPSAMLPLQSRHQRRGWRGVAVAARRRRRGGPSGQGARASKSRKPRYSEFCACNDRDREPFDEGLTKKTSGAELFFSIQSCGMKRGAIWGEHPRFHPIWYIYVDGGLHF